MKKILVLFVVALAVFAAGCGNSNNNHSNDSSSKATKSIEKPLTSEGYTVNIKNIAFSSGKTGDLVIDEDLSGKVAIDAADESLSSISLDIDEAAKTIKITGDENKKYNNKHFVIRIDGVVNAIEIDGNFDLDFNIAKSQDFALNINGGGAGNLNLVNLKNLTLNINGGSALALKGKSETCTATIDGAAAIDGHNFETASTTIKMSGAGAYQCYVTESLDASVDGLGAVSYRGNPASVTKNISGLGAVSPE